MQNYINIWNITLFKIIIFIIYLKDSSYKYIIKVNVFFFLINKNQL